MLCIKTLAVSMLLSVTWAAQALDLRVRQDPERDRRWVLKASGVHLYRLTTGEFLRHIPLPGWHWAGEPYSCAPDLAIGPRGEALITSDIAPVLWRIEPRRLTVLWRIEPRRLTVAVHPLELAADRHLDLGFSGLIDLPERAAYLAVSYVGSLWMIDARLGRAHKLDISRPMSRACAISDRPGLCVRGEESDWSVELAADGRSAAVAPAMRPCEPRAAGAGAGSGRSTGR